MAEREAVCLITAVMPQLAFGSRPSGKRLTALPAAGEALGAVETASRKGNRSSKRGEPYEN